MPVGAFEYNINNYLSSLDTVTYPWPDSVVFNDVQYASYALTVNISSLDSFAVNLATDPSGKIISVEFLILVMNGYPTQGGFQVYFLFRYLFSTGRSAFTSGAALIQPADINDAGLVASPSTGLFNVVMPPEFIQNFDSISGIRVKGWIKTTRPDIQWVKFYSDYKINIHIGSRIGLLLNTREL